MQLACTTPTRLWNEPSTSFSSTKSRTLPNKCHVRRNIRRRTSVSASASSFKALGRVEVPAGVQEAAESALGQIQGKLSLLASTVQNKVSVPEGMQSALSDVDAWLAARTGLAEGGPAAAAGLAAVFGAALATAFVKDFFFTPKLPPIIPGQRVFDRYEGLPYSGKRGSYDPKAAEEFFAKRPKAVLERSLEIWQATNTLALGLLWDWRTGQLQKNEKKRATGIRDIVTALGPTFIKIGQTAAVRPDIIPQAYADELVQLQDQVPAFSSEQAREAMAREFALPDCGPSLVGPSGVFRELSEDPVASASIGVVFRGRLADGREVAVKVQRPNALSQIALDLTIVRLAIPIQAAIFRSPVDLDLVDEWAAGFIAECDYVDEKENTANFAAAMRARGLDAVTAPAVIEELSTSRILVSEWVDGTRLDQSEAEDVPRLCSVALNAYLTMLLDTGCLHCDPHPGNLLRTRDGRLCILDWGMTQKVDTEVQYALLEYITHMNTKDYEAIPQDFVNMGFLPQDKLEDVRASGLLEPLTYMLEQFSQGGSPQKVGERIMEEARAKYPGLTDRELGKQMEKELQEQMKAAMAEAGIDVNDIANRFKEIQRENAASFSLPPYFVYVARAFAVLEGIGLGIDEDFSLTREAWPYMAKRLLSDDSPRAEAALRTLMYSAADSTSLVGAMGSRAQVDTDQITELVQGFSQYTGTTSAVAGAGSEDGAKAIASAAADLLLSERETLIQRLVVEEAANVAAAAVKASAHGALREAREARTALGPLGFLLPPVPEQVAAFVEPSPRDDEALQLAYKLWAMADQAASQRGGGAGGAGGGLPEVLEGAQALRSVLPPLEPLVPGALATAGRFNAALLRRTAEDLDKVLEARNGSADPLIDPIARGTVDVARQLESSIQRSLPSKASKTEALATTRALP